MYEDAMKGRKPKKNWKNRKENKPTAAEKPSKSETSSEAEGIDREIAETVAEAVARKKVAESEREEDVVVLPGHEKQVSAREPFFKAPPADFFDEESDGRERTPVQSFFRGSREEPVAAGSNGDEDPFDVVFNIFNTGASAEKKTPERAPAVAEKPERVAEKVVKKPEIVDETDWRAEYMKLHRAAEEANAKANELVRAQELEISRLRTNNETQEAQLKDLKRAAESQNARINDLEAKNRRLMESNDELRGKVLEAEKLQRELDDLQEQLDVLQGAVNNPMFIINEFSPMLAKVLNNIGQHIGEIEDVVFEEDGGDDAQ